MKKLLSLAITIFTFSHVFAQISWDKQTPDTVYCFETDFDVPVYNNVTFEKAGTYRWVRDHDATCGVTSAICDKNQCYLDVTDSAEFDVVANESFEMISHFYPNNSCCKFSTVKLRVFKVDEPEITTTAQYNIRIYCKSASVEEQLSSDLNIYPNPASNLLSITLPDLEVNNISVSSIDGVTTNVLDYNFANESVDISGLKSGIYILSVNTSNGLLRQKFVKISN